MLIADRSCIHCYKICIFLSRVIGILVFTCINITCVVGYASGNTLVTSRPSLFQIILNCSALPCLLHLLSSSKESIRKEACWTISNITAGNRMQIQVSTQVFHVKKNVIISGLTSTMQLQIGLEPKSYRMYLYY